MCAGTQPRMLCGRASAPELSDPQRRPGLAGTAGAGYAFAALGTHRPVIVRGAHSLEQCKVLRRWKAACSMLGLRMRRMLIVMNNARFVVRYCTRVLRTGDFKR